MLWGAAAAVLGKDLAQDQQRPSLHRRHTPAAAPAVEPQLPCPWATATFGPVGQFAELLHCIEEDSAILSPLDVRALFTLTQLTRLQLQNMHFNDKSAPATG